MRNSTKHSLVLRVQASFRMRRLFYQGGCSFSVNSHACSCGSALPVRCLRKHVTPDVPVYKPVRPASPHSTGKSSRNGSLRLICFAITSSMPHTELSRCIQVSPSMQPVWDLSRMQPNFQPDVSGTGILHVTPSSTSVLREDTSRITLRHTDSAVQVVCN